MQCKALRHGELKQRGKQRSSIKHGREHGIACSDNGTAQACTCMWVHVCFDARSICAQVVLELFLMVCVDVVVSISKEDV